MRAEAAGALGDMGETRWLSALEAMLRDPEPGVRARVAHVLGDLAQPSSAAALQPLLGDADARGQRGALGAGRAALNASARGPARAGWISGPV
ncbi:HEAT repeat domain-containing protein [Massilia sp. B-10]|nr:HEAT repeat domain-containing protein [Massilia sp. B-10]